MAAIECEKWQWLQLIGSEHGPPNPVTRLVLFGLSLRMNQQGASCFPSQDSQSVSTGLSTRTVRTHLHIAEKLGWIKIYLRPRKGQAWFSHEYEATIREDLAQYCTSKPWEDDPNWQRPENTAGRQRESVDKPATNGQHPANGARHPETGAQHPAAGARRPEPDDTTPGTSFRDARHQLPTNSSSNSSGNLPNNSSRNLPVEGAVASDRTALSKTLNLNPSKTQDPEAEKAASKERDQKIRRAMDGPWKDYADADIAKITQVPLDHVQQIRRSA